MMSAVELVAKLAVGSRAFDDLYAQGRRCPSNPQGIRCNCLIAKDKFCLIWKRLEVLAGDIGGVLNEVIKQMR